MRGSSRARCASIGVGIMAVVATLLTGPIVLVAGATPSTATTSAGRLTSRAAAATGRRAGLVSPEPWDLLRPRPGGAPVAGRASHGSHSPSDADATGWQIESTPMPLEPNGSLGAVSCVSAADCMAVGDRFDADGQIVTLAEHWRGSARSIERMPTTGTGDAYLTGVSCPSATRCIAVGYQVADSGAPVAIVDSWDGRRWERKIVPEPGSGQNSELASISCRSATACIAVGDHQLKSGDVLADAERWDGASWTLVTVPSPAKSAGAYLDGVSCNSVTSCTGVGSSFEDNGQRTLAEHWNGAHWTIEPTPEVGSGPQPSSYLSAVSCPLLSSCFAVGAYTAASGDELTLAEHRNGHRWVRQDTMRPDSDPYTLLDGVSCTSPTSCTASGNVLAPSSSMPFAERWDGHTWSFDPIGAQRDVTQVTLSGVDCPTTTSCAVVGADRSVSDHLVSDDFVPFGDESQGTTWRPADLEPALGAASPTVQLGSVSCASTTSCVAVGSRLGPYGHTVPLSEVRTGATWTIRPVAEPLSVVQREPETASPFGLDAVACPGVDDCLAVGSAVAKANGDTAPVVETWNGTAWALRPVPAPAGATTSALGGIGCSAADACTAVGTYTDSTGSWPFAERWNGSAWTIQRLPHTTESAKANLTAVSCPTVSSCVAAGRGVTSDLAVPVAAEWDGTTWGFQQVPFPPSNTQQATLNGVSCTAPTSCTAVGSTYANLLAEHWDGSTWTVQTIAAPTGNQGSALFDVSCVSASACTAVGEFVPAASTIVATGEAQASLAETWNGTAWSVDSPADPPGTLEASLGGVSCPGAGACTAVGSYDPEDTPGDTQITGRWPMPRVRTAHEMQPGGSTCTDDAPTSVTSEASVTTPPWRHPKR